MNRFLRLYPSFDMQPTYAKIGLTSGSTEFAGILLFAY